MNLTYLGHDLRIVRNSWTANQTEELHCSSPLCRFRHVDSSKIAQCFKLFLEWLDWSQSPFQTRCLDSDLELLSSNSLKMELLICLKDQSAIISQRWIMGYVNVWLSLIIRRYCGWKWRMRGQFQLLLWLLKNTHTPLKLTHSPTPDQDIPLSHDHFVPYTLSNSTDRPSQTCSLKRLCELYENVISLLPSKVLFILLKVLLKQSTPLYSHGFLPAGCWPMYCRAFSHSVLSGLPFTAWDLSSSSVCWDR